VIHPFISNQNMFAQHSLIEANDNTALVSSTFSHLSPLLANESDSIELLSNIRSLVLLVDVGEHGGYAIYTEYLPGTKPSNL
jgi:hypothetical protein